MASDYPMDTTNKVRFPMFEAVFITNTVREVQAVKVTAKQVYLANGTVRHLHTAETAYYHDASSAKRALVTYWQARVDKYATRLARAQEMLYTAPTMI